MSGSSVRTSLRSRLGGTAACSCWGVGGDRVASSASRSSCEGPDGHPQQHITKTTTSSQPGSHGIGSSVGCSAAAHHLSTVPRFAFPWNRLVARAIHGCIRGDLADVEVGATPKEQGRVPGATFGRTFDTRTRTDLLAGGVAIIFVLRLIPVGPAADSVLAGAFLPI